MWYAAWSQRICSTVLQGGNWKSVLHTSICSLRSVSVLPNPEAFEEQTPRWLNLPFQSKALVMWSLQLGCNILSIAQGHVRTGHVTWHVDTMQGHVRTGYVDTTQGHVKTGYVDTTQGHVRTGYVDTTQGHVRTGYVDTIQDHVGTGYVE